MYKGLNNIGNTCYLNAGLQLIIHNKDLCNLIVNNANNNLKDLSTFIKDYHSNNTNSLSPINIKKLIETKNNIFKGFNQQDSSEFIIYFLDLINEQLNKNIDYEHIIKVSIKCKLRSCLNISSHNEKNNIMFLDIKNEYTELNDCYREYKARIKFENDNLYHCEKCNENRIASKRTEVIYWPKHLIIVLKRFNHTGTKVLKNNNEIVVPLIWRNYNLKGIVFHSGSLFGGHYVYIGNYNNKWLLFDDNHISQPNKQSFDKFKNYGYIYYFEKE
jgi:ubiquitin carboxyl-terminal hydrolase 35/38